MGAMPSPVASCAPVRGRRLMIALRSSGKLPFSVLIILNASFVSYGAFALPGQVLRRLPAGSM
eukprot:13707230-Heterocapsa_arctica.AAC.1